MVKKVIAALALYTSAVRSSPSKNQIVNDLNEFSLQELLEFREKILEHKQNIESREGEALSEESNDDGEGHGEVNSEEPDSIAEAEVQDMESL